MASRSPLKFIVLILALAVPFWAVGATTAREVLPGLPLSRALDYGRIRTKLWLLPAVLIPPGAGALSYGLMRETGRFGRR